MHKCAIDQTSLDTQLLFGNDHYCNRAQMHYCNITEVHMKIIAIAMQKGGVGKSTLTRSLAVAASNLRYNVLALDMDAQQSVSQWAERRDEQLPAVKFTTEIGLPKILKHAERGGCDLVIIDTPPARSTEAPAAVELDMDAQQSISQWAERRDEQLPAVKFTTEIGLPKMLKHAERGGCDLVIIDTPPARSTEAPAAVEAADFVIVPCTPDIEAYEQLPRTARLARTIDKPAAVVLTMVHPNSQTEEKIAREVFTTIGIPMADVVLHRFKVHRDASREGSTAQEMQPDSKAAQEIQALWDWVCTELQIGTGALVHN